MFKYGIALINRLKYSQKFLLVGIVCLLPLLVALILLINRLNDQIVFSAKERLGLEYCITLRQMIDDLQQHRGMANSYLNGDASFKEKVAAKDRDVDAGFQRLQSLRVASSDSLLAPDEAAALEATWKQLRNDTAALTPPVSFARHTELIFRLLSLSDKITAVSNLTLDSSLDINLLISVSQKQLLYEIETMAQGRGKGSGIAAKKTMTPAERLQLSVLAENTHTTLQTLPSAMQLIYQADARWHERIGSSEETASKQIGQFYELLNGSLINAVSITVSPADYFAATTAAINAVYALYDKGVAAVDEQLIVRIEQTTKLRNFMLFFSSAMFLLVTYLFCCFYLSVKRVVLLLRQATQRVAHGDLTSRICLPVHDELSAIGADFNLMVTSLHDIVQQVHGSALSLSALSAQLTAHAEQSAQNANHIASTAGEVAAGADNNRTAVSTTASAVEEIAASIDHTQSNASSISASSLQTAVTAKQGSAIIAQTIDQINIVKQTVADSSASIRNLELHSVEIGKIIETISSIASQTDLLALNAAIESARAGEQGRGFAVVAVEVRKLAEQSQQAATQIDSLISEIQSVTKHSASAMQHGSLEVDRGVEIAGSAGASFNEIVQMIDDVSEKMAHMTDAMQEIAKGSQEIVVAVRSVDTISETAVEQTKSISASIDMQAASMREITAASHALLELATQLETSVNAFTLGEAHCISGEPQHSK